MDNMDELKQEDREKQAKWYVVHTYSSYENKVKEKIEMMIENEKAVDVFDVAVPVEKYEEIKGGKKVEKERKIFPGYVLIKMTINPKNWYIIRNTRGVTGFVGPDSEPIPLTKREIRKFGIDEDSRKEANKFTPENLNFEIGDRIKVISGTFDGLDGEIQEINYDKGYFKTVISMFGRDTIAEIPFEDVEEI